MLRKIWIVLGALALLATPSVAGLFPGEKYPVGDVPLLVAVADFDQNGRADLVTANVESDEVTVLLGHGDGTFAAAVSYATGDGPKSVAVADFDQDGWPDLVTANVNSDDVTVLLGHGNGTFAAAVSYAVGSGPQSVAVGDFDQDGRQDLVTVSVEVTVLLGHGDGTFAPAVSYAGGGGSVAVADFDRDGWPDLVTTHQGSYPYIGSVTVLLGHGDGTFAAAVNYAGGGRSVAVGEFNQDGWPDLVTANSASDDVTVLLGHGDGTFASAASYAAGDRPESVAVGDFDQDGRADLVTANASWDAVTVLLGHGDGTFAATVSYAVGELPTSVALGHFNQDGRVDLVTANTSSDDVTVLLGRGDGTFTAAVNYAVGTGPQSVAVADFDQDGQVDLVTANAGDPLSGNSGDVTILLGHGDGTFAAPVSHGVGSCEIVCGVDGLGEYVCWEACPRPRSVAVGDFNQDDHADLVTANPWPLSSVSVLLGYGDGTFGSAAIYATGLDNVSVTIGDFDQDGWSDLATVDAFNGGLTVLLGHGDGTFGAAVTYPGGGWLGSSVAVGDFDQDGRPDLVTASRGDVATGFPGQVEVFLGHGDGTFPPAVNFAAGDQPKFVAVGDFDQDGWPDLVTANSASDDVTVMLGHGDGTFAAPEGYDAGEDPQSVAVADFDQDGRADLVTANRLSEDVTVLLGRGDGTFADGVSYAVGDTPQSVAVADFDQDGRADLVTANPTYENIFDNVLVLINQGEAALPIRVDIRPDVLSNSINPYSRGVIPVAILGSDTFDVTEIDVETLQFGPAGVEAAHSHPGHVQDLNLDGYTDLMTHYRTRDTGIACGDESATLTGETLDGQPIEGSDSIQTVGCRVTRRPAIWMKDQDRPDTQRRDGPVNIDRK